MIYQKSLIRAQNVLTPGKKKKKKEGQTFKTPAGN
jgi:hypothetical protein